MKLGGNYKVGFKRINTTGYRDVLMFYPADQNQEENLVYRHKFAEKYLEG